MAVEYKILDISAPAAADLSALQFTQVKFDASKEVAACGDGEASAGILQNKPTAGQTAVVRVAGVSKCVAGAAVAPMDVLTSTANGRADAGVATDIINLRSIDTAAADGEIFEAIVGLYAIK